MENSESVWNELPGAVTQGPDEFIQRLSRQIAVSWSPIDGISQQRLPDGSLEIQVLNEGATVKSLILLITGAKAWWKAPVAELAAWQKVIGSALERMAHHEDDPRLEWSAVIASMSSGVTVPDELTFAGLHLHPRHSPYPAPWNNNPASRLREGGWSPEFPVVVTGSIPHYSWDHVLQSAGEQVTRLCAVLGLAHGGRWEIVEAPTSFVWDPEDLPGRDRPWEADGSEPRRVMDMPVWWEAIPRRLDSDPWLRERILSFHQGLRLEVEFPSWALVAFVSVIEQYGKKVLGVPKRCPGKAFREAMGHAGITADESMLKLIYNQRSEAAHEGAILGGEEFGGMAIPAEWFSDLREDNGEDFRLGALRRVNSAAKRLLTAYVSDNSS